jgi:hypothetical protein
MQLGGAQTYALQDGMWLLPALPAVSTYTLSVFRLNINHCCCYSTNVVLLDD